MVRDRVESVAGTAGADERLTSPTHRQSFGEQNPNDGLARSYLLGHLAEPSTNYDVISITTDSHVLDSMVVLSEYLDADGEVVGQIFEYAIQPPR